MNGTYFVDSMIQKHMDLRRWNIIDEVSHSSVFRSSLVVILCMVPVCIHLCLDVALLLAVSLGSDPAGAAGDSMDCPCVGNSSGSVSGGGGGAAPLLHWVPSVLITPHSFLSQCRPIHRRVTRPQTQSGRCTGERGADKRHPPSPPGLSLLQGLFWVYLPWVWSSSPSPHCRPHRMARAGSL